jgi:hypothetical protein
MIISNGVLKLITLGAAGILTLGADLHAQRPTRDYPAPGFPPLGKAILPAPGLKGTASQERGLPGAGTPTKQYDHGNPTNDEQYMLELLNRARLNPAAEGEMLASVDDPVLNAAYDFYNVDRAKLRTDFAKYPKRQPLAFNKHLIESARGHSRDMDTNSFQGHVGSNGSRTKDRVKAAGYPEEVYIGENAAAFSYTPFFGHVSLNVDFGEENKDLGHRLNIMNFGSFVYAEVGIGIIQNEEQPPETGPYVITQDFGRHIYPLLLGVVYQDKNGNNFYDPGEGMAGVRITPSSGEYYAITSASGGYAIPAQMNPQWSVTASGGGLASPITRTVIFNGENIKLDFGPGMASMPGMVTLNTPAHDLTIEADNVPLSWESIQGVTAYHLQVSTDSAFSKGMVVNDSTMTATTFNLQNLANNTTYYWRVRAKNATGWGIFGDLRRFRIQMQITAPPAAVALASPANGAQVIAGTVEFTWNPGAADVERYWFEFGTDPQMNTASTLDSTVTGTARSVSGLTNGMTYYWRVRAANIAGWGPFSPVWSVSTPTSGVARASRNSAFRLLGNLPNPFSGATAISFELAQAGEVKLSVLDALGREVATLVSGKLDAGSHQANWDAAGAGNGVYYYQLRAGDIVETRGMLLAR